MFGQLALALFLGGTIGAVSGYLGSLMLTKRMALVGGALGHLTLPGVALALLYDFDVSLGAMLFLTFGVSIIWLLERKTHLHLEALTAVVFSGSLATAFIFLPEDETDIALLGDISQLSISTVIITLLIALVLIWVIKSIYGELILAGISPDLAKTSGVNLKRNNLIYLICIAITVALGVRIVGGLMTAALLAIPACTAKNVCTSLNRYSLVSAVTGCLACLGGILGYAMTDIAPGPAIVIASAILFLLTVLTPVRF